MSNIQSGRADAIERMNRFVQLMNEVERDLTGAYARPKDAATLILVDRSSHEPKVLLGKRHGVAVLVTSLAVAMSVRGDREKPRLCGFRGSCRGPGPKCALHRVLKRVFGVGE